MRIIGVNIPDNKRVEIALTYLYGIGKTSAQKIVKAAKIEATKLAKDLDPGEINKIKEIIEKPIAKLFFKAGRKYKQ